MEVILLTNVKNLGKLGAKVKVKPGYGRNFLIPRGMALPATTANLAVFEQRRADLEKNANDALTRAQARAGRFDNLKLTIKARVAEEGKLYGSVGPLDIARAAKAQDIVLEKSEIDMPEGPIRMIGEHHVQAHLHPEVQVKFNVIVEAEEAAQ